MSRKRFRLGRMMSTPGALRALEEAGEEPVDYFVRHAHGDWGDLDAHDRQMNERAIANEGQIDQQLRVLSTYRTSKGVSFCCSLEFNHLLSGSH